MVCKYISIGSNKCYVECIERKSLCKKKKFIALKYKLKRNKGVKRESSTFYITFVSHSLNIKPCPFCDTKH